MPKGLYATVTSFPFPRVLGTSLVDQFRKILVQRRSQGRTGQVLDEEYSKLTEPELLSIAIGTNCEIEQSIPGSCWILECMPTHGFHYHSYSVNYPMVSLRRVLFFSEGGFTLEFFRLDSAYLNPAGPLEKFVVDKPSFVELAFDGRIAHRFRPIVGRLIAFSFHAKDVDEGDNAARTQTHPVSLTKKIECVEHFL